MTLEDFSWRFQKTARKTGKTTEFVIKKIPNHQYDTAMDFMLKHYLPEEAMCQSKKVAESEEAAEIAKFVWTAYINQNYSLACYEEESNRIIAVNLMQLGKKGEKTSLDQVFLEI